MPPILSVRPIITEKGNKNEFNFLEWSFDGVAAFAGILRYN